MAVGRARGLLAGVAVALGVLVLPAGAGAATICVGISGSGCEVSVPAPEFQTALDMAHGSPAADRVVVGPGRFEGPFHYLPGVGGGPIEVVGQGPATVVTAAPGSAEETVLELASGASGDGSVVSNLTVRIPANINTTANTGIVADVVNNVRVASDATENPSAGPIGVRLDTPGGAVHNAVVELVGGGGNGVGIRAGGGSATIPVTISDSRIIAPLAVWAVAQDTSIARSRIYASGVGVFACNAPVVVEDSLVRVFGSGTGLQARGDNQCSSAQGSLVARQVTVLGTGLADGQTGAKAGAGLAGQTPSIDVSLSVLRNLETVFRSVGAAGSSATVSVGASDFEAARHVEMPSGGAAGLVLTHPNIDADPLFVSELLAEFTLRPGSPAIDSSFSPALAPDESATDLAGNPRLADGNGDGVATRDMGAFETAAPPDTTPPETTIARSRRKLRSRQRGILFTSRFGSSEAGSAFECRLDAGRFTPCSSPFQKRLSFGHHRFEVRAIDAAGNADPTPARSSFIVLRLHRKHGHRRHPAL